MIERYVQVAVPVPLYDLFTYGLPDGVDVAVGARVKVPFGRRTLIGLAIAVTDVLPAGMEASRVKAVEAVLDEASVVPPALLKLASWLADYYLAPPGEAYALLLPPRMGDAEGTAATRSPRKRVDHVILDSTRSQDEGALGVRMRAIVDHLRAVGGKAPWPDVSAATGAARDVLRRLVVGGWVQVESVETWRDPFAGAAVARDTAPTLTPLQSRAVSEIGEVLGGFAGVLLHGVTGSGKTEVYLALIERVLAVGQGALVLVPEIALTPQLVTRFRARLGDRVAVQHSGLAPEARYEQWLRIRSGELPVVIGARSALFSPVRDLGIIVVDEEHEPSYKQDTSPRYHGRDLALVRGRLEGTPVVLGSATPSLESWANVGRNKLVRVRLDERVMDRPLPEVELVDLREADVVGEDGFFSTRLVTSLRETVAAGEQALLFLNRRGFSSFILCRTCGYKLDCPSCSVTYTWHRRKGRLVCHLCDSRSRLPPSCPSCGRASLEEMGMGTEQVEARLEELLPSARIGRMDRDTTRGRALARLLTDFRQRKIDVLVGTQMIAKGHDFPNVTLVGVLLAEQGLAFPDVRASERTFQLLTQIAGRAGRADKPGRVIIQTFTPEHYAIERAVTHDATGFLTEEIVRRAERRFPPTTHLTLFRLVGQDRARTEAAADELATTLSHAASRARGAVHVYAAQAAPIERIKNRWRFQVLVSGATRPALRQVIEAARPQWAGRKRHGIRVGVDVDPLSFL